MEAGPSRVAVLKAAALTSAKGAAQFAKGPGSASLRHVLECSSNLQDSAI